MDPPQDYGDARRPGRRLGEGPGAPPHADGRVRPDAAEQPDEHGSSGILGFLAELPLLVLVAFGLAVLLKTFLVQAFWIPSESMVPTLEVDDRVLVSKLSYRFGEPERGDVIVFSDPESVPERELIPRLWTSLTSGLGVTPPGEEDFIKRVIGLPGETVEGRDGTVYVDGQPLDEALAAEGGYLGGMTDDFGPFTVPDDEYFVMGDNRPFSADSRTLLGTIPRDHVVGRAFVLIWPPSRADVLTDPDPLVAPATDEAAR